MKKFFIKRMTAAFLVAAALLILYVINGSVFAVGALTALVFLMLFSALLSAAAGKKLFAKIELSSLTEKFSENHGSFSIKNESKFPIFFGVSEILIKNHLTNESEYIYIPFSAEGLGKSEAEFSFSSENCGYITAKINKIFVTDIFGAIPFKVSSEKFSKGKTTVLPEMFSPTLILGSTVSEQTESESYSPDKKGYDYSETFQLREYVPGDNFRQIHWKLSEKLDRTVVREASLPISRSTLIFWDKISGENVAPEEMDAMAEAVSSVAQSALDCGIEFTLGWNGNGISAENIDNSEKLIKTIPEMIKERGESESFEEFSAEGFGKIIWICKELPPCFEDITEGKSINILLCGVGNGENVIGFSTKTYKKDLEILELWQ